MQPFLWLDDATSVVNATSSQSANVALKRMPTGSTQIRIHNAGPDMAFIQRGSDANCEAATDDLPLPAGALEVLTVPNTAAAPTTHIAAITASGTAKVYITVGEGL